MFKNGFTLVELITVLAVITVISSYAYPNFSNLLREREAASFSALSNEIGRARVMAYSQGRDIVICGSTNTLTCDNEWSNGWLTYADINRNRKFDSGDQLITYRKTNLKYGLIKWKGAGGQSIITFKGGVGYPLGYNGSMYYCGSQLKFHRILIMGSMGYAREGADMNKNGIPEDSDGNDLLSC